MVDKKDYEVRLMNGIHPLNADTIEEAIIDTTAAFGVKPALTAQEATRANAELVAHMKRVLEHSYHSAVELQQKLKHTYWIVIALTNAMFIMGMVLISAPIWVPLINELAPSALYSTTNILTTVGIGVADLIALFLFGPITRIQKLMGNFSQLTVSLETFQLQVAIRLLEADSEVRESLGVAAGHVNMASLNVLEAIEKYYEAEQDTQPKLPTLNKPQVSQG